MNTRWKRPLIRSGLLLVALAFVAIGSRTSLAQTARWAEFHDPQTGLSFSYSRNLRIRRRDPQKFNLPQVQSIVELVGDTKLNPGTVVLRFVVKRGSTSAAEQEKRRKLLRSSCKSTSRMTIGGHEAIVCVSAGSAAERWSVEILRPCECTILTLLGGADADQAAPPPHNGKFPLLSIIRTVHFAPAESPAAH